jgi:4-hydroxy-3-polyprenylbenzoate decarboxylase
VAAPTDLRDFIQRLDKAGELRHVARPVDWKGELGNCTRKELAPLLFENVKDYPGQRVFTNGLINLRAIGIALGSPAELDRRTLVRDVRDRVSAPRAPIHVETGPAYENVLSGSGINLLKLPVPWWNKGDAGRYIGTWHVNVSRDPDDGSYNLGVYRMQVLGAVRATISTSPKSHLGMQFAKAEARGKPLEVAVAIGVNEAVFIAAAAGYPCGKNEYELAGALEQRSVELVNCQSIGVSVPANSEIVIEGFLHPGVRVMDGPYFDYAGNATTNPKAYLFEATRLAFRHDPIFRGAIVGHPGAEDLLLFSVLSEVGLFDFHGSRLRRALQILFLKEGFFRAFQLAGRIGPAMLRRKPAKES